MTASHTPTPWVVEKNSVNAENGSVVSIAECGFSAPGQSWSGTDYSTSEHQAANAEFIVRACNSHDDLMAALEDMMAWARAVSDEYIDGGDLREDYRQALSDARDALAAGRGAA